MPELDGFSVLREIPLDRMLLQSSSPHTIGTRFARSKPMRRLPAEALQRRAFEAALEHACKSIRHASKTEWISRISNLLDDGAPVAQSASGPLERIVLKSGGRVTFLELKDLDWISGAGVYLHLHIGDKTHLYRSSLNAFLQRLDSRKFVRIHRSSVVNTERIRELRPRGHGDFTIVLLNGRELTLSRAYRSQLERWLRQPL